MFWYLQILVIFLALTEICGIPISLDSNAPKTSIVEIISVDRRKRSLDNPNPGYDLEIKAFDKIHVLKLRSATSELFADGFEYHVMDGDEFGNSVENKRTPSKREISSIEESIYVDAKAHAVLSVDEQDGNVQLEGLLGWLRLKRDDKNKSQTIAKSDKGRRHGVKDYITIPEKKDSMDIKQPIATPMGRALTENGTAAGPEKIFAVTCELILVFDYGNCKQFNFDQRKIMKYLAIMLRHVNGRFATLENPVITYKLVAVVAMNSTAGQPFVEGAKKKKSVDAVDVFGVFSGFRHWMGPQLKAKKVPEHDLACLMFSSASMNVGGIAVGGGCCWQQRHDNNSCASTVGQDRGGEWEGALTLTHEIAHAMSCWEDGDYPDETCHAPEDPKYTTFIMGGGGNDPFDQYTFSKCCTNAMKGFVQSPQGECLRSQGTTRQVPLISTYIPDPEERCRKLSGIKTATFDDSMPPDFQCISPTCKIDVPGRSKTFVLPPAEDKSICGKTGKCRKGRCIMGTAKK